jgi:hypothetical protein
MQNWYRGILNTFDCPYTNGFTEGINNKIKVLNRNAYDIGTLNVLENAFCMYLDIIVQKHLKMRSKLRCMQFLMQDFYPNYCKRANID